MWKTMQQWAAPDGPKNGTVLLVLTPDGERRLAKYSGTSQRWVCDTTGDLLVDPVAWSDVLTVPEELTQRTATIEAMRKELSARETAPLILR